MSADLPPEDRSMVADMTEDAPPWDVDSAPPEALEERDDKTFSMFGDPAPPETSQVVVPTPTPAVEVGGDYQVLASTW